MIEKFIFYKKMKDEMDFVRPWRKMDDPEFKGSIVRYLNVHEHKHILSDYSSIKLESDQLIITYAIGRNFIAYSSKDTNMFDLRKSDLYQIAKDNKYGLLNFGKLYPKEDIVIIAKRLNDADIDFIPLDYSFLVLKEHLPNGFEYEGSDFTLTEIEC